MRSTKLYLEASIPNSRDGTGQYFSHGGRGSRIEALLGCDACQRAGQYILHYDDVLHGFPKSKGD